MGSIATLATAVAALLVGAALLGLLAASLRWFGRRPARAASHLVAPLAAAGTGEAPGEAALLVAEAGGRLTFANHRARELFGLNGDHPNLMQLLRQADPAERFLELFAAPGEANVRVGPRAVEATSLRVPQGPAEPDQFVVVLREAASQARLAEGGAPSAEALRAMADIHRALSASLELDPTLDAVVDQVGRALPHNLVELNLWDEAAQVLRPARHAGDLDYPRELAQAGGVYALNEGYSGWLARERRPLRVGQVERYAAVRPKLAGPSFAFESFLGVPLVAGERLVGTLELASYTAGAYSAADEAFALLIAGHAAQAIANAQRFTAQQRHVGELSGLAEITRALEATADPRELYGRLTADIARFMGVQSVGLLAFDANARALIGQPPFFGVPDIVANVYRIPIRSGSAGERMWQSGAPWQTNDVAGDAMIDDLGLREWAQAVGAHTTLLAPVGVGERRLGMVHITNKNDGAPFGPEDVRLLTTFAGQVAAILDNARLVREAQARAEEADGLRGVAAATTSGDLDSALARAMRQAAALLHFDMGMVVLLDETRGELVPHPASFYGGSPEALQGIRLSTHDPIFALSVTRTRRPFITGRAARDRRIVGFYKALVEHFQVNSAMDVPLIAGQRSIGEIIVVAQREQAFSRADLTLLGTVSAQLAAAIDRARLYAATDQNLQRRVDQLTALTRVSRELSQTVELPHILQRVHAEVVAATRADCGTIVLLEGEPPAPRVVLRLGDETLGPQLTPLEAEVARGEQAIRQVRGLAADSELAAHAGVQAALVVPILTQNQVAGLIHVHTARPEGFDDAAEEAAVSLAAQTAIAIENARRFEEQKQRGELLGRRADQLGQLFEVSRSVRSDQPLDANLEAIAFGLQEAVGFDVVLVSVLDPKSRRLRRTAAAGLPLATFDEIRQVETAWDDFARLLRPQFRISHSYFLPAERAAHLREGAPTVAVPLTNPSTGANAWQPDDMLLVPLHGSGQEPVGLLTVDNPRDGQRPGRNTIEIIEIFANQAAQAIENARLYAAAERRAGQLLALHRVVEAASAAADRRGLWQTVAEKLLAEMPGPDVCLIALGDARSLSVVGHAGQIRPHVAFGPLLAGPNPLGHVLSAGALLALDPADSGWDLNPAVMALEVGSFACVPIFSQAQPAGALFVGAHHKREQPSPFSPEDVDVFTVLANQLGALLASARLEADVQQRAAQLAALAEVSQTITATLRVEDVVQAVLGGLHAVVPYDSVTLWLRDGDELRIVAADGFENNAERLDLRVQIRDSVLFAEMDRTLAPILVPEVRADARFAAGEFQPTQSWLAAPLVSKGNILGVLALDKTEAHYYPPQAAQVLMAFANQAAVALDNARLFEESGERAQQLDERSQRLGLLNRVSAQLSGTLAESQIGAIALSELAEALGLERAVLVTFDDVLQTQAAAHLPADGPLPSLVAPALARVRETAAALAIEDATADTLLVEARPALVAEGVKSLLVVPLTVAGQVLAAIQGEEVSASRRFTPGEIELAQTLANQAAVALQNARLFAQTQANLAERIRAELELRRRHEELITLNRVTTAATSQLDLYGMLETTAREMVQVFDARSCGIGLLDPARTSLTLLADYSAREADVPQAGLALPLAGNPALQQLVDTAQPLVVAQAQTNPLAAPFQARLTARQTECLLLLPLRARGAVVGTIALDTDQAAREFTSAEVSLAETIAGQISGAVENARFAQELEHHVALRTQELERERQRVETLLQITTELASSLDLDLVLSRALDLVSDAIKADRGAIFLLDMETNQLIYRAALGRARNLPPGGLPAPFKRNEGLIGWVIKHREGVVVPELDQDPRWVPLPDLDTPHRSALVVPLMASEDALGAIILFSPLPNAFQEDQLRLVAAAANQVGAAINNAELYRLIRDQAERLGGMLRAQQVEATKSRAILEGTADGVLVADADGIAIVFNHACELILGLKREAVLGRPVTEFMGIYGAAGKAWVQAINRWSRDPNSYRPGDFVAQRIDLGQQVVISIHLSPVIANEEYLGAVSVIRDITREVEVDRLKSEFVSNVSHELRTPMTSIKGYADLLLMGAVGRLEDDQSRAVQVIKDNADRLALLVNDLLDIARIESGRVELVRRPLQVAEVIEDVAGTLRSRIDHEGKPMTVQVEASPDLPEVLADRERIRQIVMNLAENAFQYSHAGGRIALCAAVDTVRGELVVTVTDRGVGIEPADQPRLFDRFFRGEHALVLARPGAGLGLAIARQLAERHGGRLWLEHSDPGKGSTFALALPLSAAR